MLSCSVSKLNWQKSMSDWRDPYGPVSVVGEEGKLPNVSVSVQ